MASPRRVLFIEDDPTTAIMYGRALTHHGYSVETVADGTAGFERLTHNPYDIILLDLMIPGIKGPEILKRLATRGRGPAKIIILTNMTNSDHEQAKLAAEADAYLLKAEVVPSQLIEEIERLLK